MITVQGKQIQKIRKQLRNWLWVGDIQSHSIHARRHLCRNKRPDMQLRQNHEAVQHICKQDPEMTCNTFPGVSGIIHKI